MSDYNKIKKMMVDKPVFKISNPENPVHYELKQKPSAPVQPQVAEAAPEAEEPTGYDQETAQMRAPAAKQLSAIQKLMGGDANPEKVAEMQKRIPTPGKPAASPDFAPDQAKPLGPIASSQPRAIKTSDPVDDKQSAMHMIDSILNNGPDDVERILNELDHIDDYELSDNDKRYVYNSVYEELRNQGRVDFPDEE